MHSIRFQGSFTRDNLAYVVRKAEDKDRQLLNILRHVPGTAIVYVNTRKKANTAAQVLQKNGVNTTAYHAGLTALEREARQEAWINGTTRVIVATNAFGMGIDKPNVRSVIHLDLPTTLEAYYQEAGRAGRDEKKAYAVTLYDHQDIALLRERIRTTYPSLDQLKQVYQHLANYYQVAVGSHNMTTYDFDLEDFSHTYGLKPQMAYQSLKTLEGAGLVQLNEAFSQPAQLHITTDPKTLYAFQVAHAPYGFLIKALLRLYGGELFSVFGNISVQHIAHFLKITPQEVKKQLQALERLALIQYSPQKATPQLTFTTLRHPAASLPLDRKILKQRTETAKEKAEAVVHYTTQQYLCRVQVLLAYFGETTYQKCGQCDVCLAKEKKGEQCATEDYQKYRHLVLQRLQAGIQEVNQIVDSVDLTEAKTMLATIRQMLDNGELSYDHASRLMQTHPLQPKQGR